MKCTTDTPIGLHSSAIIKDEAFSASSHYKGYPPSMARLNTEPNKAWYAEPWDVHKPWIQIDLGAPAFVSAVASQGKKFTLFVKSYKVKYSEDKDKWYSCEQVKTQCSWSKEMYSPN